MLKLLSENYDSNKLIEYSLVVGYFCSLFISTCFFFDSKKIEIFHIIIQFPIGLIFFPLTFGISNILQDIYGKLITNTVIATSFIFDTVLVFGGLFLAWMGDRNDFWTVFKDIPNIMIATWLFLGIGSIFNITLYNYFKKIQPKNIFSLMLRFFITITSTEILTSTMSMPLMFYKHGLHGSIILTILAIVLYKICANFLITFAYGFIYPTLQD